MGKLWISIKSLSNHGGKMMMTHLQVTIFQSEADVSSKDTDPSILEEMMDRTSKMLQHRNRNG